MGVRPTGSASSTNDSLWAADRFSPRVTLADGERMELRPEGKYLRILFWCAGIRREAALFKPPRGGGPPHPDRRGTQTPEKGSSTKWHVVPKFSPVLRAGTITGASSPGASPGEEGPAPDPPPVFSVKKKAQSESRMIRWLIFQKFKFVDVWYYYCTFGVIVRSLQEVGNQKRLGFWCWCWRLEIVWI